MESGESIYNLIPGEKVVQHKPTIYKSKFHQQHTVPPSCSTFGLHGTTKVIANESGNAHVEAPRAHTARGIEKEKSKAAVVKRTEKPVMGLTTDRNFVQANALEAVHTQPPRRPQTEELPTQRPTFGKVPPYLKKIKQHVDEEYAVLNSLSEGKTAAQTNRMQPLSEPERAELLAGLKRKWEEAHKQYQRLTFNIDTTAKTQKKEGLEVEMERIEKAMQKLSKKNIYVYDDLAWN